MRRSIKRFTWLLAALLLAGCVASRPPLVALPPDSASPASPQGGPFGQAEGAALCLSSAQMINERTGWILTQRQDSSLVVLRTGDGGWIWEDVTPPSLLEAQRANSTFGAFFGDGSYGWVAMGTALADSGLISLARTADGGRTWAYTEIPVLRAETSGLRLSFTDPNEGWLLITSSPAFGTVAGTMYKSVWRTTDGGASWQNVSRNSWPGSKPTEKPLPNIEYVTGLGVKDPKTAWVTAVYRGDRAIPLYRTLDGGKSWERQALEYPAEYAASSYANTYPPLFFGRDRRRGVLLVEFRSDQPVLVSFQTKDGGQTWEKAGAMPGFPANPYLPFYDFTDVDHGFAMLGDTLYKTEDGGMSWTGARIPALRDAQLEFVSPKVGWAVVDCGLAIYRTGDGGATWLPVQVVMPPRRDNTEVQP